MRGIQILRIRILDWILIQIFFEMLGPGPDPYVMNTEPQSCLKAVLIWGFWMVIV